MAAPRDDLSNNPLLQASTLPHGAPRLDQLKAEYFLPAIEAAAKEARAEIAAIKNNPAAPTFDNTILALETAGGTLDRVNSLFDCITNVKTNDDLMALEDKIDSIMVKYTNDVNMDETLFARVKAVYDQQDKLNLTGEQKAVLKETYQEFLSNGALLNAKDKEEMRKISERLAKLNTDFRTNVLKSTSAYQKVIDNEADLAGIPERAKNNYKAAAEDAGLPGKWVIKLSPPPTDIMEYAENRALRQEIQLAASTVGEAAPYDNKPLILEIVALRARKAKLLGFDSHAANTLSRRMAKTPQGVNDMLEKNLAAYKPAAEKFMQQVKDYAKKTDGIDDLQAYDYGYYSRKLKEETFSLDEEEVRPYFDLDKTLDGMLRHAEKLFNITITKADGKYPVYADDVKVFEVKDNASDKTIGVFYGDYFARPGEKRPGAWMSPFRNRGLDASGQNQIPIVYNSCNYPKPAKGQPSLLSLNEVRTLFHEFGHGLHGLLAEGNYGSVTGTNVKWDWVEVPSQLQENWAMEKDVLDTFAKHHETGETLPAALVQKIKEMENFDAAYVGLRQTMLGLLDMKWHTTDPATITSVAELEDSVRTRTDLLPRKNSLQSTSFSHIFAGGYSAGYYSYKWAEVLEADIYAKFQKDGLYNGKLAKALRDTVYSKGSTVEPDELFRQLMGRDPDPQALFRREGLLPANGNAKAAATKKKGPKL